MTLPSSSGSSASPSRTTRFPGFLAAATVGALVFGTVGAGLLLTPTASSPAAADPPAEPSEAQLLQPAATVQQHPDTPESSSGGSGTGGANGQVPLQPQPNPEDTVTAIVRTEPTSWWDFEGTLARVQKVIASEGEAGNHQNRQVRVVREYDTAFTGLAIEVPRWAIDDVQAVNGVQTAFIERTYALPEPQAGAEGAGLFAWENGSSLAMTGADLSEDHGEGMLISIIDSGLDTKHEAFAAELDPTTVRLSKEAVEQIRQQTGSRGAYLNSKIPFVYDYADSDNEVSPIGAHVDLSHGTHVAGIAAANAGDKIRGTAPGAQIMAQKVFDNLNGSARDSVILAALDDAAKIKPDVINLSLGSDSGFSAERDGLYSAVYDTLRGEGVLVAAAAGNSAHAGVGNPSGTGLPAATDPDYGVIAAPSSYTEALAVASFDNSDVRPYLLGGDGTRAHYVSAQPAENGQATPFSALPAGTYPYLDAGEGQYDVVDAAVASLREAGGDPANTIFLITRGGEQWGDPLSFQDKLGAAINAGAKAVVFIDNIDSPVLTVPALSWGDTPAALISKQSGAALLAASTRTLTVSDTLVDAPSSNYIASGFSSMGVTPELELKPDVAAPGGDIFSAMPGGNYELMSGTSMASPQIAGILALLKQHVLKDPTFAVSGEREAAALASQLVMNTAVPVLNHVSNAPYTPRKQGAGIANVPAALATPVTLEVVDSADPVRPAASLGDSADGRFSFTVIATNRSSADASYQLDVAALSDRIADGRFQADSVDWSGRGVTVSFGGDAVGDTLLVPAGGTATVQVQLAAQQAFFDANAAATNGTYLDGFLRLRSASVADLTVPYLGFVGSWADVPVFDANLSAGNAHVYGNAIVNAGSGIPLGVNPLDELAMANATTDPSVIRPERAVMSPTRYGDSPNRVQTVTGLLRNVTGLDYELIRERDQSSVKKYSYSDVSKSSYAPRIGRVLYAEARLPYAPVFAAYDEAEHELEPGSYRLVQTATTAGQTSTTQTHEYTVQYDNAGPRVESVALAGEGESQTLQVTVSDESWLASLDFQEYPGAGYFHRAVAGDPTRTDEQGRHVYELAIPVRDIRAGWDHTEQQLGRDRALPALATLYAWDYGLNPATPQQVTLFESPVTGVSIEQRDVTLAPQQTVQLSASVQPENAQAHTIEWSSSDPAVVAIDADGTAAGVAVGTVTVTATVAGTEFTAAVPIQVAEVPESVGVIVSPTTLVLAERSSAQLQALLAASLRAAHAEVSWQSSDTQVATVQADGTVTAGNRGEATLTATVRNAAGETFTAQASLSVRQPDYADYVVENGELVGYAGSKSVLDIPSGITRIGDGAFAQTGATSIRVPATVTHIGDNAFRAMPALQRVTFEDGQDGAPRSQLTSVGNDVFNFSTRLRSVNLPDSVTSLGVSVFENTSIDELSFPSALTEVPARTFLGATGLKRISFGDRITHIGEQAFARTASLATIELPESLTTIDDGGFISSGLTRLRLPVATERLGESAFAGNPLRSADLGNLREMGRYAFSQTRIEHLVLPDTLQQVGIRAFAQIADLVDVTVGRSIPADALIGVFDVTSTTVANPKLAEFIVPANAEHYSARAGMLYDKAGQKLISYPRAGIDGGTLRILPGTTEIADLAVVGVQATALELPDGLQRIGEYAFAGARFTELTTPASLTDIGANAFTNNGSIASLHLTGVERIGDYAFAYNEALAELDFGTNLQQIGVQAFQQNTSLTRVVIPDSVQRIGEGAFLNSTKLTSVHLGAGVTEVGEAVFTGIRGLTELTVAPENPAFVTDQNVLYGRGADGLHLMLYLPTKTDTEYTVLDGTVRIDEQAFRGNHSVRKVVLPEGVRVLGVGAFNSMDGLEEVVLPDSLEVVDGFYFNTSLRNLEFGSKITTFADFWSLGSDIEQLVVRGASGASYQDSFGVGNAAPKTAFFGPGMKSVSYTFRVPTALVVSEDLAELKLGASWMMGGTSRVYAPAGSAGWQVAAQTLSAAGLDVNHVLQPYTPLAVTVTAEQSDAGLTALATATGGVTELAGESQPYLFRFSATAPDGTVTVLQDWSTAPGFTGKLSAGSALSAEVRDATRLTARVDWSVAGAAPVVTGQPTAVSVVAGKRAEFTATATGDPAPTVQWQAQTPGGQWQDIAGATATTLVVEPATLELNGTHYRAVFQNEVDRVVSEAALLSVSKADPEPGGPEQPGEEAPEGEPVVPELTPGNRGTVQLLAQQGNVFTVSVGTAYAEKWVGASLHSDPKFLGWAQAGTAGQLTVTVPADATGAHRLSFVDRAGQMIGWLDVKLGDGGGSPGGEVPGATDPGHSGSAGAGAGNGAGPGTAIAHTGAAPLHPIGAALVLLALLSGAAALVLGLGRGLGRAAWRAGQR